MQNERDCSRIMKISSSVARNDTAELQSFTDSPRVYQYLPTFLFEHKYQKSEDVIDRLYTECLSLEQLIKQSVNSLRRYHTCIFQENESTLN